MSEEKKMFLHNDTKEFKRIIENIIFLHLISIAKLLKELLLIKYLQFVIIIC